MTAPALILPTTVTQADIQAAAYTLGQCLRFNADTLPFRELTEGWNVRLLLDQLAPPVTAPSSTKADADIMSEWLANIVQRSTNHPVGSRVGWLLSAARRVAGPAFIDLLAVELGGELLEAKPRLSHDLAGLAEILNGLPKR